MYDAAAVTENTAAAPLYYYYDTRIVSVMGGLMTPKISQVKWTMRRESSSQGNRLYINLICVVVVERLCERLKGHQQERMSLVISPYSSYRRKIALSEALETNYAAHNIRLLRGRAGTDGEPVEATIADAAHH